jgi:release factor glutamine methyltransferase
MSYIPHMSDDEVNLRKQWHDALYQKMEDRKAVRMQYLGRRLVVPREVTPPAWMSKLLGKTILEEVRESDLVLDMGTGSGINAILAASKSHGVVAVDINPFCVGAGTKNAELNGVSARIQFKESDLFKNVTGKFDMIIFDPPFRWFAARDLRELAVADENFRSMTLFFDQVRNYLKHGGRILMEYGDSGDMNYFLSLIERAKFKKTLVRERYIVRNGRSWGYYVWKLTD